MCEGVDRGLLPTDKTKISREYDPPDRYKNDHRIVLISE